MEEIINYAIDKIEQDILNDLEKDLSAFHDKKKYIINFDCMIYNPTNEQGVIVIFSLIAKKLGFLIKKIRTKYPDCVAMRWNGKNWEELRIEFEYLASNFILHKHDPSKCDLIICWENDLNNPPLPIFPLSKIVKYIKLKENEYYLENNFFEKLKIEKFLIKTNNKNNIFIDETQKESRIKGFFITNSEEQKEELNKWSTVQIRKFCKKNKITIPSGSKKSDMISQILNVHTLIKNFDIKRWSTSSLRFFCHTHNIKIPTDTHKNDIKKLIEYFFLEKKQKK